MSLLIPLALLVAGALVLGISTWRDPDAKGSIFVLFLYVVAIGGPVGCVSLGAWSFWRTGQWESVSVGAILAALEKAGAGVGWLRQAGLPPLQDLNRWYLDLNLGWTLLAVPAALIGLWLILSRDAPRKQDRGTP